MLDSEPQKLDLLKEGKPLMLFIESYLNGNVSHYHELMGRV